MLKERNINKRNNETFLNDLLNALGLAVLERACHSMRAEHGETFATDNDMKRALVNEQDARDVLWAYALNTQPSIVFDAVLRAASQCLILNELPLNDFSAAFSDSIADGQKADLAYIRARTTAMQQTLRKVVKQLNDTAESLRIKLDDTATPLLLDRENASMIDQVTWFANDLANLTFNLNMHYAQQAAARLALLRAEYCAKYHTQL